jgi:hypothetical protein
MLTARSPGRNPTRQGGLGTGERVYRHVNECIRELERTFDFGEPLQVFCECDASGCHVAVAIDPGRYEEIRLRGTQFVVAPTHARPEVESIVERRPSYWIVEVR